MKKTTLLHLITFTAVLLMLSNCTLQKRTYTKGYYVEWNKNHKFNPPTKDKVLSMKFVDIPKVVKTDTIILKENTTSRSLITTMPAPIFKKTNHYKTIDFKNSAPVFKKETKSIKKKILYKTKDNQIPEKKKPINDKALVSFIFGLLSTLLLIGFYFMLIGAVGFLILVLSFIIAVIAGILGITEINNYPNDFRGKELAVLGILMPLIAAVLIFLILGIVV